MLVALVAVLATGTPASEAAEKIVINFDQASILPDPTNDEIVTRPESWTDQGVELTLARQPAQSRARGRLMLFPHLPSGRQGILNAMADEQEIPVRVRFPRRASKVAIEFWASTGAAARLEAFDAHDAVVARDALDVVPGRKAPEEPIPMFTLAVSAAEIAYVEFSGPRTGEFLAAAEVRVTLVDSP
ncbi:MAG: hypothetical protein ABI895_30755 [Deltaproteobacteria bacterium]